MPIAQKKIFSYRYNLVEQTFLFLKRPLVYKSAIATHSYNRFYLSTFTRRSTKMAIDGLGLACCYSSVLSVMATKLTSNAFRW